MKNIKVLGTGCANCNTTMKLIEETAKAKCVEIRLEKVEDMAVILGYGVMSTPGVVASLDLNGRVPYQTRPNPASVYEVSSPVDPRTVGPGWGPTLAPESPSSSLLGQLDSEWLVTQVGDGAAPPAACAIPRR